MNFPARKLFRMSTPKIKEPSTIEPAYLFGSQEQYYIPCPHCNPDGHPDGNAFVIKWDMIRWSKEINKKTGVPADVWLECPFCNVRIEETSKTWMLARGGWYSTKGAPEGERYRVEDSVEDRSFQISSLYSPYGFFSWRDAVKEWFEYKATNDVNMLQVFINQTLGESFTLVGQEISSHALAARCEEYGPEYGYDVPQGGLLLTAGVDVQEDRLECEIVAWGLYDESWGIEYVVFPGDTNQLGDASGMTADGQPSVWLLLDQYLMRRFKHKSGVEMPIEMTMIDARYRSEVVHIFCRLRESRRVYPVKGKDGWGYGLFQPSRKRHERFATFPYIAYVDELKTKLYSFLQIEQPGPGFCHYPKRACYGDKYFKGLVSETRKTKMVGGRPKLYWDLAPGARNEPIDCRNYAYVGRLAYPVDMHQRAAAVAGGGVGVPPRVARAAGGGRRREHPGI